MVVLDRTEAGMPSLKGGRKSVNSWGKIRSTVTASKKIAVALRKNFMFLSLSDKAIFELAMQFEIMECQLGQTIIHQGAI